MFGIRINSRSRFGKCGKLVGKRAASKPRCGPLMEVLEDRRLMSAVTLTIYGETAISSFTGVGFRNNPVAMVDGYVNGAQDTNPADYSAQIDWGDGGGWQAGQVVPNGAGTSVPLIVQGTHVYEDGGSHAVQVMLTGPDGQTSTQQTCTAYSTPMPSTLSNPPDSPTNWQASQAPSEATLALNGVSAISSFSGVGFRENPVAVLDGTVNGNEDTNPVDYHAQVNFGDSPQWIDAQVTRSAGASEFPLLVKATHTYEKAGSFPVVVFVTGPTGQTVSEQTATCYSNIMPSQLSQPSVESTASSGTQPLGDATLIQNGVSSIGSVAGVGFANVPVAVFSGKYNNEADGNPGDYSAEINWGDSPDWIAGTIVPNAGNSSSPLQVEGSHVYPASGSFPVVVYLTGPDGQSLSEETATCFVSDNPNPGPVSPPPPAQPPTGQPPSNGPTPPTQPPSNPTTPPTQPPSSNPTPPSNSPPSNSTPPSSTTPPGQDPSNNPVTQSPPTTPTTQPGTPSSAKVFQLSASLTDAAMNAARQLDQLATNLENGAEAATEQFFIGLSRFVTNTLTFLAQPRGDFLKPGVPAQQLISFISQPNPKFNAVLYQAAQQDAKAFQANPAEFLGENGPALLPAAGVVKEVNTLLKGSTRLIKAGTALEKIDQTAQAALKAQQALEDAAAARAAASTPSAIANSIRLSGAATAADQQLLQQVAETIANNPVSLQGYLDIADAGAPITLDFTPNPPAQTLGETIFGANPGQPPRVIVYVNPHDSIDQIVQTLVHESKHVRLAITASNSLYEEYFANIREFLYQNLRKPTVAERMAIWKRVAQEYASQNLPNTPPRSGLHLGIGPNGIPQAPGF